MRLAAGTIVLLALLPGAAHSQAPPRPRPPAKRHSGPKKPVVWCSARRHHHCRTRPHRPPPPTRPGAATDIAAAVSGSGATLTATVYPAGSATTYWFQYGPTTQYGAQTAQLPMPASRHAARVTAVLAGLNPLAVYHYRVVASHCHGCAAGTIYAADATLTVGGWQNPVYSAAEAADPFVLDNGNTHNDYWAYTTGNLFEILHSSDLVHWTSVGNALSGLPSWVVGSGDWHPWAPSVVKANEPCPGAASAPCYVMYYVGLSAQFGANCVATATATGPGGPFIDQGPLSDGSVDAAGRPLGCGDDAGYGVIDPSPFADPATGQPYLYVSEDFACAPGSASCTPADSVLAPTISVIALTGDYLHPAGPRRPLFSGADGTWEAAGASVATVEGPSVTLHNGTYYLMYSGGSWHTTYGMGYATAPSPTGPFTKSAGNPILSGTSTVLSPGGGDAVVVGPHGGSWLVYHGRSGSYALARTLRVDPFSWRTAAPGLDVPVIGGPTSSPQATEP